MCVWAAYSLYKIISKPSVILIIRNYENKQNGERDPDSLNAYIRRPGMKVDYKQPEQKSRNKANDAYLARRELICVKR